MRWMISVDNFQIAKAHPQCVCCLAFAFFFSNFSLALLIKKACNHFLLFIFITLVRPNSGDSGLLIILTSKEIKQTG